jgi:hypothetical protein
MRRRVTTCVATSLILLATCVAVANDGALEINAACIATGCFPGDAPGLPVQTQAGKHYVMTSDVAVPSANTDGINLAAYATLDMNGFALAGPVTCTGAPAVCAGSGSGIGIITGTGATVRNGTVRGMGSTGQQVSKAVLIENLFIEQNAGSGIAGTSDGAIIRGCRISRNGITGISLAGFGSAGGVVTGNTIVENGGFGVDGNAILVLGNSIAGNDNAGIALNVGSSNGGFTQNVITNNNGGNASAQTSGGKDLGANVCGTRTTCP